MYTWDLQPRLGDRHRFVSDRLVAVEQLERKPDDPTVILLVPGDPRAQPPVLHRVVDAVEVQGPPRLGEGTSWSGGGGGGGAGTDPAGGAHQVPQCLDGLGLAAGLQPAVRVRPQPVGGDPARGGEQQLLDLGDGRHLRRVHVVDTRSEAARSVSTDRLWANPDCGLKTRGEPEAVEALRNLVRAAGRVRSGTPAPA